MNRTELMQTLKEAEVNIINAGTLPTPNGEGMEYELEFVPRNGLLPKHTTVLFDNTVGNPASDNGTEHRTVVAQLSDTEAAVCRVWYPEYCDDEADGYGTIEVHEWDDAIATKEMEALVERYRKEAVGDLLSPIMNNRDMLLGPNWNIKLVEAIAAFVDKPDRIGVLLSLANTANNLASQEAKRKLMEMAPYLASMELEYESEHDDQGGMYTYLSRIVLTAVSNETEIFSGDEDPMDACEGRDRWGDFEDAIEEELGESVDGDVPAHEEAFWLWIGAKYGVADWKEFWSVLWAWIDAEKGINSVTFRETEVRS